MLLYFNKYNAHLNYNKFKEIINESKIYKL